MAIAKTVVDCLQKHHVPYSVVGHRRSISSKQTAETARVNPEQLAKAVMFEDGRGYVMAVIPSNRHVRVDTLSHKLGRELHLATESHLVPVFRDCDVGAIPPVGPAYGIETIMDDSLVGLPEVYFEAGDHEELIRVEGEEFVSLLGGARHGQFTQ